MLNKTEKQIDDEIFEVYRQQKTEDHPKYKEMILAINDKVSDDGKQLHNESIVIDLCTFSLERFGWNLAASGMTAMNCTVPGTKDSAGGAVQKIIDYQSTVQDNEEQMMMIYEPDDILKAKKEGKVGVIIGAQSCEFVHHDDLDASINLFQRVGLRVMTIAYNHRTFAADGCFSGDNAGLTNDGRKLIKAMQKYGVTVDLSHVGERSTLEAMDVCTKPPIFSHSNPLGVNYHVRNITDEQAKKCAELGGVVGVSSYGVTLFNGKDFPTIETFIDCIDYFVNLIGIDHVGCGLDTDATMGGYDHRAVLYFHRLQGEMGKESFQYKSYMAGRGFLMGKVDGLINMANFSNVTDNLLKRGYKKQDIQKILGLNWLRIFKQTW